MPDDQFQINASALEPLFAPWEEPAFRIRAVHGEMFEILVCGLNVIMAERIHGAQGRFIVHQV